MKENMEAIQGLECGVSALWSLRVGSVLILRSGKYLIVLRILQNQESTCCLRSIMPGKSLELDHGPLRAMVDLHRFIAPSSR